MSPTGVIEADVRCVHAAGALLGEGPVWVARESALYWTDIKGLRLHRYTPATGAVASWSTPMRVGSLAPRASGGFVAGVDHGFALIDPEAGRYELIARPEPHLPGNRFNDGKLDGAGRFWAGTMDDAEADATGALYRLDADHGWTLADGGYRVTNGPAFSPDGAVAYHTDSATRTIHRFDVDAGGALSGKADHARFGPADGHPDGMTVDVEGCLWVAFWDGWCVRRLSSEGRCISKLPMPVQRPTSCTFGGDALDRLYVTSATIGLDPAARAAQPLAGGLFEVRVGVAGIASTPFAG